MCPECGEPHADAAALVRLSQASGIPVDQLVNWFQQDKPEETSTPEPEASPAVLKVITGGPCLLLSWRPQ
jgi:hypothetical protein